MGLGAHDKMSAHFATLQDASRRPPAISGLMPFFRDNAHSLALVEHGMEVIAKATEHVNHGQVPVVTVDQPFFAIVEDNRGRGQMFMVTAIMLL